jgi:hypothetical protein
MCPEVPSVHGGGGAKVFRGPTPARRGQSRGSNARPQVVGKLLAKAKLRFRRRPKVIAIEPLKAPKVVEIAELCEGKYGKACWDAATTRCSFCGRRVCSVHSRYYEGQPYCIECYDSAEDGED